MKKVRLLLVGVAAVAFAACPLAGASSAERGPSETDLALIDGIIQLVEHDYVHKIEAHQLTTDALKGMMNRLDPHSDYMTEQEFKESQADISGKFGGLGIEISEQQGVPKIIAPIDGTPASKAGLEPGDRIVAIDGKSTRGVDLQKIVRILRGKPGTSVTISIARGNQKPFDVKITRNIIQVQTVKSKLEPHDIGYARITEFGAVTPKDFKNAIEKMKQQAGGKLNALVLDLRNDPGGLLTSAVSVAGGFLNGGTVVTIHGRHKSDDEVYSAAKSGTLLPSGTPIVVLINGASASASEIVAGALQDRKRATVMGTQSFGKGSVQTIIPLNGHGALRLTTALYYTPSGRSIQGKGISPDIVVEAPKDEQVAGELPREATLNGAFHNPGPLGGESEKDDEQTGTGGKNADSATPKADLSAPIKPQLIATPKDAQLNAALAYLEKKVGGTTAAQNGGANRKAN